AHHDHEGGLARAVGSQKAVHAGREPCRHAVDGDLRAELLGQPIYRQFHAMLLVVEVTSEGPGKARTHPAPRPCGEATRTPRGQPTQATQPPQGPTPTPKLARTRSVQGRTQRTPPPPRPASTRRPPATRPVQGDSPRTALPRMRGSRARTRARAPQKGRHPTQEAARRQ